MRVQAGTALPREWAQQSELPAGRGLAFPDLRTLVGPRRPGAPAENGQETGRTAFGAVFLTVFGSSPTGENAKTVRKNDSLALARFLNLFCVRTGRGATGGRARRGERDEASRYSHTLRGR
jgi:hypothetical protein